jgi:hypothetical protein
VILAIAIPPLMLMALGIHVALMYVLFRLVAFAAAMGWLYDLKRR